MDNAQYIKKITWAKNAVWPVIIFSLVSVFVNLFQGFSGAAKTSVAVQSLTWIMGLLGVVTAIIYFMGFWAMGKHYNQRDVRTGIRLLFVAIIFAFVFGSAFSFFLQEDVQSASISIIIAVAPIVYLVIVFLIMGIGYIFLGKGLKKLESNLGAKSRTIGNLFFSSGICTLTLIGVIGAVVLWFIAYIMSYKFFSEELKRVQT